jgi:hypothetical protein
MNAASWARNSASAARRRERVEDAEAEDGRDRSQREDEAGDRRDRGQAGGDAGQVMGEAVVTHER